MPSDKLSILMSTAFVFPLIIHSLNYVIHTVVYAHQNSLQRSSLHSPVLTVRTFFRVINIFNSVTQKSDRNISYTFAHGRNNIAQISFVLHTTFFFLALSASDAWRMHIVNRNKSALHASLQWYNSCRETNDKRLNLFFVFFSQSKEVALKQKKTKWKRRTNSIQLPQQCECERVCAS